MRSAINNLGTESTPHPSRQAILLTLIIASFPEPLAYGSPQSV